MSVFDLTVDPVSQPRCTDLASLPDYLRRYSLGPPVANEGGPQRMVVSLSGVEDEAVTWSALTVVSNGRPTTFVIDARTLYPSAPELHKIVLKKDMDLFKFVPGRNYSEWLSSTHLEAVFYRSWLGRKATSTPAWPQDAADHGYGEFLVRAYVLPMEDPRLAEVMLAAIPVSEDAYPRMSDNHVATTDGGFPCVLIDAGNTNPVSVGPRPREEQGNFGLPCYPVLIMPDDAVQPPSGQVVEATRNLWAGAGQPFLMEVAEWVEATAQSPVATEDKEVDFPWPRIAPVVEEQAAEGKNIS